VIRVPEEQPIPAPAPSVPGREIPADLVLIVVWLAAAVGAIYVVPQILLPLRVFLALPVILFIPGYCLLAALFTKKGDIDLLTRMVLSLGISLAIVPLIGLGLNFTPWAIRLDPIVVSLTVFSLATVIVAYYRRSIIPSEERFSIPFFGIAAAIYQGLWAKDGNTVDRILNIVLAISIVITVLIAIYVMTVPLEGEHFTEFFILGENRTADSYPATFLPGQNYPMYVGVVNHEYRDVHYTIETWMLSTEFDNMTNSSRILAMDPNNRLSLTLAHNESAIIPYNLSVQKSGYNRMEFLLFKETVYGSEFTGSDRINASYRELHLRLTGNQPTQSS
jgi:uncharacterized membrane protein